MFPSLFSSFSSVAASLMMATSNGKYNNHNANDSSSWENNSNSSGNTADNVEPDSEAATMRMLMANLPSTAFSTSTPDPRLQRACQEMERTKQITPVLKEELRLRILHKRMEKGEPEIETGAAAEPKKYEVEKLAFAIIIIITLIVAAPNRTSCFYKRNP